MGASVDPLGTPKKRRDIWATIAGYIATDLRDTDGWQDGARQALEYAILDDPPREWPEGTYGWTLLNV